MKGEGTLLVEEASEREARSEASRSEHKLEVYSKVLDYLTWGTDLGKS